MFTPNTAAEAIRGHREAARSIHAKDAQRLTETLIPWFMGLGTFLTPYRVRPIPPAPTLHPEHAAAYVWVMEILPPSGEEERLATLIVTAFANPNTGANLLLNLQLSEDAPETASVIGRAVTSYADETLNGAYDLRQTTMLYRGGFRG